MKKKVVFKAWMRQIAKGQYLHYCTNKSGGVYVIQTKNKRLAVHRTGKCEPKKCKSACCKFIAASSGYFKGFGTVGRFGEADRKIKINCSHLKKGKCSIWKKHNFPIACRQYPHPTDKHYWEIFEVCTFKFELIGELKDKPKKREKIERTK